MDKLSQDSCAALAAGMSYGKYMAMKNPVKVEPPEEPQGVRRECQFCGEVFYRYDRIRQKYCSDRCRKNAENKRARQPDTPNAKICAACGKEFIAATWRNKYCSQFCRQRAQVEVVRNYQKRKKEADSNELEK